jgi:DNA mismatch endonuclease (patch repair protein)
MKANRRRDTKIELVVRSSLHRMGLRFRVDYPIRVEGWRPIRVDLAFTRLRICVELDGCFWHGCPECCARPVQVNGHYWNAKLARNKERDAEQTAVLEAAGWTVLRFWEHEGPEAIAATVARRVREAQERAALVRSGS